MAWLCKRSDDWQQARVIAHVPTTEDPAEHDRVVALLAEARINAEVVDVEPTVATLVDSLGEATLVLAPLRVSQGRAMGPFGSPMGTLIESLPLAIMVLATEEIELTSQSDNVLAELARATERADVQRERVAELDMTAARLLVAAEQAHIEADAATPVEIEQALAKEKAAQLEARNAFRLYLDAKTRLDGLLRRIEALDPHHAEHDPHPSIWQSAPISRKNRR